MVQTAISPETPSRIRTQRSLTGMGVPPVNSIRLPELASVTLPLRYGLNHWPGVSHQRIQWIPTRRWSVKWRVSKRPITGRSPLNWVELPGSLSSSSTKVFNFVTNSSGWREEEKNFNILCKSLTYIDFPDSALVSRQF